MALRVGTSPKALITRSQNRLKRLGAQRHDGQARLADEQNVFQLRIRFDGAQRDRPTQRFDRGKIDGAPVAFGSRLIRICFSHNFRDADDGFVFAAVIKEDLVTLAHSSEIISRREITYTGPVRFPLLREVRPRIGGGFRFNEPEIFHMVRRTFDICLSLFHNRLKCRGCHSLLLKGRRVAENPRR
jgi:hypothetical protein